YPYFILGVFLVSLVAFQAELRRFLLRLGEGGWLQYWVKSTSLAIDPIVAAAERLARRKIGALIAMEKTGEVEALTESGVRIDALVSTELLETIFWPGTALHDLGVIIQRGRITAAGCQFPLAEVGEVDRSLGSRHRAALGMSLETDSLVIVVSEETGTISAAVRGKLRRALTGDALRHLLIQELAAEPAEAPSPQAEDAAPPEENGAAPSVAGGSQAVDPHEVQHDRAGKTA
ncbi:MAG: diadenylate cyclase, partial [Planctomycetes bacterium]|nr:diadenylate cyclase [Planctomycetota bacterium]